VDGLPQTHFCNYLRTDWSQWLEFVIGIIYAVHLFDSTTTGSITDTHLAVSHPELR
jgi:hypothetical protein